MYFIRLRDSLQRIGNCGNGTKKCDHIQQDFVILFFCQLFFPVGKLADHLFKAFVSQEGSGRIQKMLLLKRQSFGGNLVPAPFFRHSDRTDRIFTA